MKILLVRKEFFHVESRSDLRTEGQRNLTQLTVVFRNFGNAPKKAFPFDVSCNISDIQSKVMYVLSNLWQTVNVFTYCAGSLF